MTRRIDYAEEIRRTMANAGYDSADLAIDATAVRLSGESDGAAEHHRVQLRRVWDQQFSTSWIGVA